MHLFICTEQVDAIALFPRQIGVWVKKFERAPSGSASILLEADNGASALVGSLLHSNRLLAWSGFKVVRFTV